MKKKNILVVLLSLLILLSCVACTPSRSYRHRYDESSNTSSYKSNNNKIKRTNPNTTRKSIKTKNIIR